MSTALGGQTVKNLPLLASKFELDQSRCKSRPWMVKQRRSATNAATASFATKPEFTSCPLIGQSSSWRTAAMVPTRVDTRQITFADTRSACDVIGLAQTKSCYTSPWGVRVRKRHWRVPTRVGIIAAVHHDDDCTIRGQLVNSGCVRICGRTPLLDLKHWSSMAEMRDF